jgi:hypothetical protein
MAPRVLPMCLLDRGPSPGETPGFTGVWTGVLLYAFQSVEEDRSGVVSHGLPVRQPPVRVEESGGRSDWAWDTIPNVGRLGHVPALGISALTEKRQLCCRSPETCSNLHVVVSRLSTTILPGSGQPKTA